MKILIGQLYLILNMIIVLKFEMNFERNVIKV